ncbi:hypothetical protein DYGSA30_32580 [Dyella sp. GSA-30]|nr:hypothetical protein DYGSA30_32580 [Dyella sp. GSA-30]
MEQGPHIVPAETVPVVRSGEQPYHIAVRDHDTLGFTGRTRGVDDVSQVMWLQPEGGVIEIVRIRMRPRAGIVAQIDYGCGRGLQDILHGLLQVFLAVDDHRDRRAIGQGVAQTLGRIGWIQRHIGAAGLQNPQ